MAILSSQSLTLERKFLSFRVSGIALLSASYDFIVENWIEWFPPSMLITAAAYFLMSGLNGLATTMPFFLQFFFISSAFGLLLTFLMIFRGLLFTELNGTTRRSRVFRYQTRAGSDRAPFCSVGKSGHIFDSFYIN